MTNLPFFIGKSSDKMYVQSFFPSTSFRSCVWGISPILIMICKELLYCPITFSIDLLFQIQLAACGTFRELKCLMKFSLNRNYFLGLSLSHEDIFPSSFVSPMIVSRIEYSRKHCSDLLSVMIHIPEVLISNKSDHYKTQIYVQKGSGYILESCDSIFWFSL